MSLLLPELQRTAPFMRKGITSRSLETEPGMWVIVTMSVAATSFSYRWLLMRGR